MRPCRVTTRFHGVTKLVSGTASSWMRRERETAMQKQRGKEKCGRSKKKFGEWRLALGKVRLPLRLEGKRYVLTLNAGVSRSEIVKRIELASFDVQLLPMENAFSRYRSGVFRPWNIHADAEMRKKKVSMRQRKITRGEAERQRTWKCDSEVDDTARRDIRRIKLDSGYLSLGPATFSEIGNIR